MTSYHEYERADISQRLVLMFEQWLILNGATINHDKVTVNGGSLAEEAVEGLYSGKTVNIVNTLK